MSTKTLDKSDKDHDNNDNTEELFTKLDEIAKEHIELKKTLKGLDERLNIVVDKLKYYEETCHKIEAKLTEAKDQNKCQNTRNLRTSGLKTYEKKYLYQLYEQAQQIY